MRPQGGTRSKRLLRRLLLVSSISTPLENSLRMSATASTIKSNTLERWKRHNRLSARRLTPLRKAFRKNQLRRRRDEPLPVASDGPRRRRSRRLRSGSPLWWTVKPRNPKRASLKQILIALEVLPFLRRNRFRSPTRMARQRLLRKNQSPSSKRLR